ncbi:MAG: ParB/RepB/Spo0J family partition protein [Sulfuricurvum sp.]|jgi:ParB family chromosome partitioning protein|uniref:ParB/RepB/Spo0J family partition protein n=1 Tax=Sulfuricurvum sp. TaxID=2025608 RepID=UPI0025E169BB|nr:ParB/RepB/Spo0J family partition protein [Sulfuricurvum sp.]MCK9372256.1 ParB/RepB/Spo0J family partition protein [Sulfuricurvum sp.]
MQRKKIDYSLAKKISQSAALTEQLHAVEKNPEVVIEAPISKLQTNPYQPRITMEPELIRELAESIEQNGLIQPIVVAMEGDVLTIIAGHRRVEAHKYLKKEFIKAIVMNKVVHAQLALLPLVENLQRSDMDPIENAIAFKKILDDGVVQSQNELADKIGVSKSWLSKTLSILRLPDTLIQKIQNDHYTDITVLSALNKISEEKLTDTYEKIKGLQREESLDYIKMVLTKPLKEKGRIQMSKKKIILNIEGVSDDDRTRIDKLLQEIENILGR